MSTVPLGAANPALLAQCPSRARPDNAEMLPVHFTEWNGGGPTVQMVHGGVQGGIGGGPINFAAQRPMADMGWRLRLIDRPGFGDSPSRGDDDMEVDSILIADGLGESSHLIGHSFGGAGALLAAARRPEAVRSLILIEPALQSLIFLDTEATDEDRQTIGSVVMKYLMEATTPGEFAMNFARSMSRPSGALNVSAANIASDPDRATQLGCSLLRARAVPPAEMKVAAERVRAARIPVLIVSAGYSPGQEVTARSVARLTGGSHVVVPCDTHFVQQDNPEGFNGEADAFMRSADRERAGAA